MYDAPSGEVMELKLRQPAPFCPAPVRDLDTATTSRELQYTCAARRLLRLQHINDAFTQSTETIVSTGLGFLSEHKRLRIDGIYA